MSGRKPKPKPKPKGKMDLWTKIHVSVSVKDVVSMDVLSKSDLVVRFFLQDKLVGITELQTNKSCVRFVKSFVVDYMFEEQQWVRVDVWDIDQEAEEYDTNGINEEIDELIGGCRMLLGKVCASNKAFETPIVAMSKKMKKKRKSLGVVCLETKKIENQNSLTQEVELEFAGIKLKSMDFLGESDPYFIIIDTKRKRKVYKSEFLDDCPNPEWNPMFLNYSILCEGEMERPMKFECFDKGKIRDTLIGRFSFTLKDILKLKKKKFELMGKKGKKKTGEVYVKKAQMHQMSSLLDYLGEGMEISIVTAIDFTLSNGDPKHPKSLHHLRDDANNDYQNCIVDIGNIIKTYDKSNSFPTIGFGGKFGSSSYVNHNYMMNRSAKGVKGILAAYRRVLSSVTLSGPTYFNKFLNYCNRTYGEKSFEGDWVKKYHVILILTDGTIDDMDLTIKEVIKSSHLPISLIILGIGDENFDDMVKLNSGKGTLKFKGDKACRNNTQFINYSLLKKNKPGKLASTVLKCIPEQVCAYFKMRKLGKRKADVEKRRKLEQQRLLKKRKEEQMVQMKKQQALALEQKLENERRMKKIAQEKQEKYLRETPQIILLSKDNNAQALRKYVNDGGDSIKVDEKDKRENTALYYAVKSRFPDIVGLLIDAGADPKHCLDVMKETSISVMKILFPLMQNVEYAVKLFLFKSIQQGNLQFFQTIVKETKRNLTKNMKGDSGKSLPPVHWLIRFNRGMEWFEAISKVTGFKVDVIDGDKNTPLEVCLAKNKIEEAQFLISLGSNLKKISFENRYDNNVLHYFAERKNSVKSIEMVLSKHDELRKEKNSQKQTAVMISLKCGHVKNFEVLYNLEKDKKIILRLLMICLELRNYFVFDRILGEHDDLPLNKKVKGEYLIQYIVKEIRNSSFLALLLKKPGLNIDIKDSAKNTPLENCLAKNKLTMAKLLINVADLKKIRFEKDHDNTVLHYFAKRKNNEAMIEMILEKHAKMRNDKNDQGRYPIVLALETRCFKNFQVLYKQAYKDSVFMELLHVCVVKNIFDIFKTILTEKKEKLKVNSKVSRAFFKSNYIIHHVVQHHIQPTMLKLLLEVMGTKINIDIKDHAANTPLENALAQNKLAVAKLLTERGANLMKIRFERDHNNSILHWFAKKASSTEMIELIISQHAKLLKDKNLLGQTPVQLALSNLRMKNFNLLLKHVVDSSEILKLIVVSVEKRKFEVFKLLVGMILEKKKEKMLSNKVKGNYIVQKIIWAKCHVSFLKHLCDNCSSIKLDVKDDKDNTPLETALSHKLLDVAVELIKRGANLKKIRFENDYQNSILHYYAKQSDALDVLKLVLDRFPKMAKDKNDIKETPIQVAAKFGKLVNLKELVKYEKKGMNLLKCLFLAVTNRKRNVFDYLLDNFSMQMGLNRVIGKGTILHHVIGSTVSSWTSKLLSFTKIDINAMDGGKRTPLMIASQSKELSIVRELIQKGADITILSGDGTPFLSYLNQTDGSFEIVVKECPEAMLAKTKGKAFPWKLEKKRIEAIRGQLTTLSDTTGRRIHTIQLKCSASELPSMDLNGFSDPYFTISCRGRLFYKSEKIKKTLSPSWKNFSLVLCPEDDRVELKDDFLIQVWDWDMISSDDFISEFVFSFKDLLPAKDGKVVKLVDITGKKDHGTFTFEGIECKTTGKEIKNPKETIFREIIKVCKKEKK